MKKDTGTQAIIDLYSELKSQRAVASKLNVSRRRVAAIVAEYFTESEEPESFEEQVDGDTRVVTGKGVSTAEDLIRIAGIDLTEWIIEKKMVNCWDAMSKDGPVKMHQIKLWLSRRPSYFIQSVKTGFCHKAYRAKDQEGLKNGHHYS